MKGYPKINLNGKTVCLHRKTMEEFLGRKLKPYEIVHHKDGNKLNYNIENLELLTRSEHAVITGVQRVKKTKDKCKEENCADFVWARGFCPIHYNKDRRKQKKNGTFILVDQTAEKYISIKVEGKWIPEHIAVMERFLGRKILSGHVVHHIDEDKKNNNIVNLIELSNSEHIRLHNMLRDHPSKEEQKERRRKYALSYYHQNKDRHKERKRLYDEEYSKRKHKA